MIDYNFLRELKANCSECKVDGSLYKIKNTKVFSSNMIDYFFPYYQGKTGYCWLEATLQSISLYEKRKTGKSYYFDDEYLIFFDKLEKANLFLENIISETNDSIMANNNSYFLRNAISDRGQWKMAQNLIEKYGLVIKDSTVPKKNIKTSELNVYLSQLLKKTAICIRNNKYNCKNVELYKNKALQNVFDILVAYYGNQCDVFFSLNEKKINPIQFYKKNITFPFDAYISIYPCERGVKREVEIMYDGNIYENERNSFFGVWDNEFTSYLNTTIKEDGFCWCSGDFGKYFLKEKHVLDDTNVTMKSNSMPTIKLDNISRNELRKYRLANMTHAFVVTLDGNGNAGYYAYDSSYDINHGDVCWLSESWASKYLLQAIVKKEIVQGYNDREKLKMYPWEFF